MMSAAEPTFIFLRNRPVETTATFLTSSLQTVDTVFLLIALQRYPHALSACASAIESAIKMSPSGKPRMSGLQALIEAAREQSSTISNFSQSELDIFRRARNRITHEGFSPKDDSESTALLIRVAFPFLDLCLRELYSFDLTDSLIQEYAKHLSVATKVYQRVHSMSIDYTYCFRSFAHLIRWNLKENFAPQWECAALDDAEEGGAKFSTVERAKGAIERSFGAYWDFNCPICGDIESAVTELAESSLESAKILPGRMICVNCEFRVAEKHLFLSEVLLEAQVAKKRLEILREYGVPDFPRPM